MVLSVAVLASSPALAQFCVGDCNGDRRVTANELIQVLRSQCGSLPPQEPADVATELELAVGNVFGDCGALPSQWEVALDASQLGYMMSGWGTGDGAVWVVGGRLFEGVILRFAEGQFEQVDLDFPVPLLNWVHGTSETDVFVAANDGAVLHYDGASWTVQDTPVSDPVWGIWAQAADDVWAVGGEPVFGTTPFVMRYDGQTWTQVELPPIVRPGVAAFFKVWGSGPDDIYAVGQNGIILHWDGASFTEMGAGISQDLIGIWGNAADDITVVGGRGTAEFAHFDGTGWTRAPTSAFGGLNGVWTRRPDVAHTVGVRGTILRIDPSTLEVIGQDPAPTDLELHGVFGDATGQILAFGANFTFPEAGIVLIRGLVDDD